MVASLKSHGERVSGFVKYWKGKGYEKGQSQPFWLSLLREVLDIDEPEKYITFEDQVHLDNTSFIDGYIESTRVMIEQKSLGKDLDKPIRQSDGTYLNPFQQAKRYIVELPVSKHPKWVVTCNFEKFLVYDMENPSRAAEEILLENLPEEYWRLEFLVNDEKRRIQKEVEVSKNAGTIVKHLYDALSACYKDMTTEVAQKSLNKLIVRLVFCLYAEDAEMFEHGQFSDYLKRYPADELSDALYNLFQILDTPEEKRRRGLNPYLAAFPYTNGGLFHDREDADDTEIPLLTDEVKTLLIEEAAPFNWSHISPTIFGGIFESTLNPETRRGNGMHYTSIENIHKVIDPLFLDDLKEDLEKVLHTKIRRKEALYAFQNRLASLTFLDPACGSGNFLTETYLSLRRLENEVIKAITGGNLLGLEEDIVKVSIGQFYGIEINDFAVAVASTALWISESQMLRETEHIIARHLDPLPLKTYTNIHEGNALRMDWNEVVPASELNYISGNPPFLGYALQSKEQKDDLLFLSKDMGKNIDYVAGWYVKSAGMIKENRAIHAALVSTNSITQGEQAAVLWTELWEILPDLFIEFAHRTFRWDSEAQIKAHVHCVIIGFSAMQKERKRRLYDGDEVTFVSNINPYLVDGPNVLVTTRKKPVSIVPEIVKGSIPVDGGNLIIEAEDFNEFVSKEPAAKLYIKKFVGAREFLHNEPRYCLWLIGVSPAELSKMPQVKERVRLTREFRLASSKEATRKYADYPTRFMEVRQPQTNYIIVPSHSSEGRTYIPMGFMSPEVISSNANLMIPDASLYHFGVLESIVHMAWMRVVCGRIKSDYRYSNDIVYNNFPWPQSNNAQKDKIEKAAQSILDARALYPDSSLADLYDETLMPPELRRAHRANDAAVLEAYGFSKDATESDIVARLFRMYQELTS